VIYDTDTENEKIFTFDKEIVCFKSEISSFHYRKNYVFNIIDAKFNFSNELSVLFNEKHTWILTMGDKSIEIRLHIEGKKIATELFLERKNNPEKDHFVVVEEVNRTTDKWWYKAFLSFYVVRFRKSDEKYIYKCLPKSLIVSSELYDIV